MVIDDGDQLCKEMPKSGGNVIEEQETTQVETKSELIVTKERSDLAAHQALDEMFAPLEIEEVLELNVVSNHGKEIKQVEMSGAPILARKHLNPVTSQPLDEMPKLTEKETECSNEFPNKTEMLCKEELVLYPPLVSSYDDQSVSKISKVGKVDESGNPLTLLILIPLEVNAQKGYLSILCFDPGGASMIFDNNDFLGCLPLFDFVGLLENSQDAAECVELLMFDPGGSLLVIKALWLTIVIANFIAPHLVANLKGDRDYIAAHIAGHCLVELLPHASTATAANIYVEHFDFVPDGALSLVDNSFNLELTTLEKKDLHLTNGEHIEVYTIHVRGGALMSAKKRGLSLALYDEELDVAIHGIDGQHKNGGKMVLYESTETGIRITSQLVIVMLTDTTNHDFWCPQARGIVWTRAIGATSFVFDPGGSRSRVSDKTLTLELAIAYRGSYGVDYGAKVNQTQRQVFDEAGILKLLILIMLISAAAGVVFQTARGRHILWKIAMFLLVLWILL